MDAGAECHSPALACLATWENVASAGTCAASRHKPIPRAESGWGEAQLALAIWLVRAARREGLLLRGLTPPHCTWQSSFPWQLGASS